MVFPYDVKTEQTRKRIFPFNSYRVNKVYEQNGLYVFCNQKGYIHALKPCQVRYDGVFSHYEITDYMLTPKDTFKQVSSYGCFKTREECIERILGHF